MKTVITFILGLAIVLTVSSVSFAATINFTNGQSMKGTIMRYDGPEAVITCDYGIVRYSLTAIKSIDGKLVPPVHSAPVSTPAPVLARSRQFPRWREVVTLLEGQPWATGFRQIPATVVDKGVMRNVPYLSFKCGADYEMNIYGDPDDPASVEIGVRNELLKNDTAKSNCVEFIASLFADKSEKGILRAMDRRKSIFEREKMTYEITPETDEDAYGGWWVSAYSEKALDASRATDPEVANISVPRQAAAAPVATANFLEWSASDLKYSRPPVQPPPVVAPRTSTSSYVPSKYVPFSFGRVYVRGYFRKNGTYVSSHTRSR